MTTWHIVTGEYPPAVGGLSDYSRAVAAGLAAAGDEVHVWCPPPAAGSPTDPAVLVHAIAGGWGPEDLRRLDDALGAFASPRRLLVQWIPHAYGHRSLNVAFCRWVRRRARAGDDVDLMIHEPGLGFREGALRHDVAAALHRMMLMLLLGRARRVWVAIPAWVEHVRRWTLGRRDLPVGWLPVPSSIPVSADAAAVRAAREAVVTGPDDQIVGHFGTYSPAIRRALCEVVPVLLADAPRLHVRLLGRGSEEALVELRRATGSHERLHAAGELDAAALSAHLRACDLLLQPYPDGASTRRTTLMAALAHGLPVVTTIGRLSEPFWSESDAIATVPADDSSALARTVAGLMADPERRARLGAAGRAAYDAQFSLRHVIAALRADAREAAA